jgi:hypothetical protein
MNVKYKILFLFLIYNFVSIGQFNIQAGYDYGFFKPNLSKELEEVIKSAHFYQHNSSLHRLSLVNEYILKNKLIISVNSGIGIYNIDYKSIFRSNNLGGSSENISIHSSSTQTFRLGISLGYQLELNSRSSLIFKTEYDQHFVNRISIKESYNLTNLYDVPVNEIDFVEPSYYAKKILPTSFANRGFKNKLIKENGNLIFSLRYRYLLNQNFFACTSFSFSPSNVGFFNQGQHMFLLGINLGYIFPLKDSKNDK